MDGGVTVLGWIMLWQGCRMMGPAWPNGGGVIDQPAVTVRMFELISEEAHKAWQTSSS